MDLIGAKNEDNIAKLDILSPITQSIKADKVKVNSPLESHSFESIDFSTNLEFSDSSSEGNPYYSLRYGKANDYDITPQRINLDIIDQRYIAPKKTTKFSIKSHSIQESKLKQSCIIENEMESIHLYKIWPGNNRFLLKGRLMIGPKSDRLTNTITWTLILGISLIYFFIALPYLWGNITIILPLISIYLFVSTITFLFLTSFTDPGIIPRKSVWELSGDVPYPYNGGAKRESLEMSSSSELGGPDLTKARPILKNTNLKLCKTCLIYRPPRSSHCNECGNCVEVFDHHCPFVNNCIGKRNYRYFLGFLVSLVLLGVCYLCGFLMMLVASVGNNGQFDANSILQSSTVTIIIILILGIPTAILLIVVLLFCAFHCWLVLKGKTTKEKLKGINITVEDAKENSVNWCRTDPCLFNPRQLVGQDQLLKFWSYNVNEKPGGTNSE